MGKVIGGLKMGAVALALVSAGAAQAQTVSSNVEGTVAGVFSNDPKGPTGSGPVNSFLDFADGFDFDFEDPAFGSAVQRLDGVGAVVAEGLFADGQPGPNVIVASTTWSESVTNNTAGPASYSFTFFITPAELWIGDYAGASASNPLAPQANFDLSITVNGQVVFEAGAELRGGFNGHVLTESGTSLNPALTPDPLPPFTAIFGYIFDSYIDVLSLGTFNPGETVTVEYQMQASVSAPGFETGARAQVGDPFDLDGTPGFTGSIIPDSPVATTQSSWGQLKDLYGND